MQLRILQVSLHSTAHLGSSKRQLGYTLSAITCELLTNPEILKKLKAELALAIPDPNKTPTCAQIENLPYLSAVIYEALRLYPAFVTRMQRVSPDEPLYYGSRVGSNAPWTIPAGTCVSMQARTIHLNPTIFSEPKKFRPERWLENPRLDRYLIAFSRGTRGCIGYYSLYIS